MDALKLALVASVAFTAGCPIFDDEPEEDYEHCSATYDVSEMPDLALDVGAAPVVWEIEATFTGVGREHGDGYGYGHYFFLRADAVAVSNDPEVESAPVVVTLGEVGADEPWISTSTTLAVGDPRTEVLVDEHLAEHLEDACGGMETCTLDLELRIESLAPAVVVLHNLNSRLRSSMNTSRYEGCGISEYAVDPQ